MNPKLLKFIELCLVDGVISDKEREVVFRKSKEFGVPEDECEIILEGMIQKLGKKSSGNVIDEDELKDPETPIVSLKSKKQSKIKNETKVIDNKQIPNHKNKIEKTNELKDLNSNSSGKIGKLKKQKENSKNNLINLKTIFFSTNNLKKIKEPEINKYLTDNHCYLEKIRSLECFWEYNTKWIIYEDGNILLLFGEQGLDTSFHDYYKLIITKDLESVEVLESKSLFRKTFTLKILNDQYVGLPKENIELSKVFLQRLFDYSISYHNTNQEIESLNQEIESLNQEIEKNKILVKYDSDNNGTIDLIEGIDEFYKFLKKNEKKIIKIDGDYIHSFVKISEYLKIKKNDIQNIFMRIKNFDYSEKKSSLIIPGKDIHLDLDELTNLLDDQIYFHNLLLVHSINMVICLIENDRITFFEIYESFDKLKIFKSDHESEVSEQLQNIGFGLRNLLLSIDRMENKIVKGLNNISYDINKFNSTVSNELKNIESSINFNNLLTGIQTYQTYKINKNTKSLRG
jgi:hypothetical protein